MCCCIIFVAMYYWIPSIWIIEDSVKCSSENRFRKLAGLIYNHTISFINGFVTFLKARDILVHHAEHLHNDICHNNTSLNWIDSICLPCAILVFSLP